MVTSTNYFNFQIFTETLVKSLVSFWIFPGISVSRVVFKTIWKKIWRKREQNNNVSSFRNWGTNKVVWKESKFPLLFLWHLNIIYNRQMQLFISVFINKKKLKKKERLRSLKIIFYTLLVLLFQIKYLHIGIL